MRNRTAFRAWVVVPALLVVLVILGAATVSASNADPKDASDIITQKAPPTQSAIEHLQAAYAEARAATVGDTIQVPNDFDMDGCGGIDGWNADEVQVYPCYNQPTAVEVSVLATAPAAPKVSPMELVAAGILVLSASGLFLLVPSHIKVLHVAC